MYSDFQLRILQFLLGRGVRVKSVEFILFCVGWPWGTSIDLNAAAKKIHVEIVAMNVKWHGECGLGTFAKPFFIHLWRTTSEISFRVTFNWIRLKTLNVQCTCTHVWDMSRYAMAMTWVPPPKNLILKWLLSTKSDKGSVGILCLAHVHSRLLVPLLINRTG